MCETLTNFREKNTCTYLQVDSLLSVMKFEFVFRLLSSATSSITVSRAFCRLDLFVCQKRLCVRPFLPHFFISYSSFLLLAKGK